MNIVLFLNLLFGHVFPASCYVDNILNWLFVAEFAFCSATAGTS